MLRKTLILAVALAALLAAPAAAGNYPPPPPGGGGGNPPPNTTPSSTVPPNRPTTTLSPSSTVPGARPTTTTTAPGDEQPSSSVNDDGSVRVRGACEPNQPYSYEVRRGSTGNGPVVQTGSGTSDANGEFTTEPLPNGQYTIAVTCGGETTVLGVNVGRNPQGVVGAGNNGRGGATLPDTGSDSSIPLTRLGMILVATGGLAVYAAKKRNVRRAAFIA